jgi:hypothetical protein
VGVNGILGFCIVAACMYFLWHLKLDSRVLAASSLGCVVGLMSRWYQWHYQENRFRITMTMKREAPNCVAHNEL